MREDRRGDGSVALYGGDGDGDMVLIEPAVEKFTILNGDLRCACGARLRPWSLRHTSRGAELCCYACHKAHAQLELGVRTYW
jgi:hypothetical protein